MVPIGVGVVGQVGELIQGRSCVSGPLHAVSAGHNLDLSWTPPVPQVTVQLLHSLHAPYPVASSSKHNKGTKI